MSVPPITEFLLARIAEDEEVARAASPGGWSYPGIDSVAGGTLYDETRRIVDVVYENPDDNDGSIVRRLLVPEADANGAHIARHDPARVLAECEAKRRIVQDIIDNDYYPAAGVADGLSARVLEYLADVYADHPDFDSRGVADRTRRGSQDRDSGRRFDDGETVRCQSCDGVGCEACFNIGEWKP